MPSNRQPPSSDYAIFNESGISPQLSMMPKFHISLLNFKARETDR